MTRVAAVAERDHLSGDAIGREELHQDVGQQSCFPFGSRADPYRLPSGFRSPLRQPAPHEHEHGEDEDD